MPLRDFGGRARTRAYGLAMPALNNPFDSADAAQARSEQDDAWAMYFVVCQERRLTLAQAITLGGAGAVMCADRFRGDARWQDAFVAWQAHSYRKIALRADNEQFTRVRDELDAVTLATEAGEALLTLPPRRKSERESALTELAVFTDTRLPATAVAVTSAPTPALIYIVRADVMKSMGKAMAQGGHAALMCADGFALQYASEFTTWRANGLPGEVALASDDMWERLKAEVDCVVVKDAGLTQVALGTETVLALPPLAQQMLLVDELSRL